VIFVESFHSRFRDEYLNREQLWTLTEARVVIEDFRQDYNAERPHSSLGYFSPQRFVAGKSLPIPSSGPDRQAGPSLRLGLPTTTESYHINPSQRLTLHLAQLSGPAQVNGAKLSLSFVRVSLSATTDGGTVNRINLDG
jgi:hypothetical protein